MIVFGSTCIQFSVVGSEIPSIAPTTNPKRKKKKIECDICQVFKDEWATKFPWVELVINLEGKLHSSR